MLSRTLLTLSVSMILGTAVVAPSAALAQFGHRGVCLLAERNFACRGKFGT
jgi:hypothetical protein